MVNQLNTYSMVIAKNKKEAILFAKDFLLRHGGLTNTGKFFAEQGG